MRAVAYHGKRDVRVDTVPDPTIQEPTDAIVRVTSSGICGSDLHLYEVLGAFMDEGDILGHEPMGIVEEVGSDVKHDQAGRSGGDSVQHLLRALLYVRSAALLPVRDHAGHEIRERGLRCSATPSSTARFRAGRPSICAFPRPSSVRSRFPKGPPDDRSCTSRMSCRPPGRRWSTPAIPKDGTVAVLGLGPIGQMSCRIAQHHGAPRCSGSISSLSGLSWPGATGSMTIDLASMTTLRGRCALLTDGRGPDAVIDAVGMEAHGAPLGELAHKLAGMLPGCSGGDDDPEGRRSTG